MKNKLILITIILMISTALFAQEKTSAVKNEFMWKVGGAHAADMGKFGLDMSFNYMYNFDPLFAFGFEGDFFWLTWTDKIKDEVTNINHDSKKNLYVVPLFLNGQIRIPFVRDIIGIEPAATFGFGFACMFGSNGSHGAFPALQGLGSLYFNPFQGSNIDFVIDFGYRYLPMNSGKKDMSGFVARFGIKAML